MEKKVFMKKNKEKDSFIKSELEKEHKKATVQMKKYHQLIELKELFEGGKKFSMTYHGLGDISPCAEYPLFVQWNHPYPVVSIVRQKLTSTFPVPTISNSSEIMPLPMEIGYAIERILGTVKDEQDYQQQIDHYFKIKKEGNVDL